ncbi:interleukin 17-like protein [Mizuhopecten yessoensis]|uniref:interleukin 17-like protein n=1 Tax=Mizuhopecten yessoensis TaxID=6573 RepID=UPI000B459F17|nr:interleukin 17-like protein [Mizuhopecten yessoensis]
MTSTTCYVMFVLYMVICTIIHGTKGHIDCQEPEVMPSSGTPITGLESDTLAMLESYNRGIIKGVPCIFNNITRELVSTSMTTQPNFVADMDRGVCPWRYHRNTDPNRIPNVLYEARCSATNCDGCQTDSHNLSGNKCKEIYFYISVLRRVGCIDNVYRYSTVLEPLSAGCTCLGPAPSSHIGISNTAGPGLKANN